MSDERLSLTLQMFSSPDQYTAGYALAEYSTGHRPLPAAVTVYARDKAASDYPFFLPQFTTYHLWVQQPAVATYMIVLFDSEMFLRGLRDGCRAHQVDFRNRLLGLPFRREGDRVVYYTWQGYDLPPYQPTKPLAREGLYHVEYYEDNNERPASAQAPV